MARRTVLVSRPAHIRCSDRLLEIKTDERTARIPFDDVGVVIVESRQSTLTAACASELMEHGCSLVTCDASHMPNGVMVPTDGHCRHSRLVEDQLKMPKPLVKQLWKSIVQQKIQNQAFVLGALGLDDSGVRAHAKKVRSGDSDNREGAAAAEYFRLLIPDGGRRESIRSGPLDYGYAILRAAIGRQAVAAGWLLSKGLHHHSQYNAFNLVDDLIEPFRPLVDLVVMANDIRDPIGNDDKRELVSVLMHLMKIGGKRCSVDFCIEELLDSLRSATKYGNADLLRLPVLYGLELAAME